MSKYYRVAFRKSGRLSHWLYGPLSDLKLLVCEITDFFHRGMYGWAYKDIYAYNQYLGHVMAEGLEEMARHTKGCPLEYANRFGESGNEQWRKDLFLQAGALREMADNAYNYSIGVEALNRAWDNGIAAMHWVAENLPLLWW